MSFRGKSNKKNDNNSIVNKADTLAGMQLVCAYFGQHSQKDPLFQPEYEVSKAINSIIEQRVILTKLDVIEVLNLLNDIDKVEHYNGSGWYDYQIRLAFFLRLSGFNTETRERKLYLV
jgi:hypothetical protein